MPTLQLKGCGRLRIPVGRKAKGVARLKGRSKMFDYKRIAKPRNTLPNTAAKLRPALGTKPVDAAPVLPEELLPVGCCPPNPVMGIEFVAEAPPVGPAVAVEERDALPKKGLCAPQG